MSYIDDKGSVFLITEAPTEADRGHGGSFGTDRPEFTLEKEAVITKDLYDNTRNLIGKQFPAEKQTSQTMATLASLSIT